MPTALVKNRTNFARTGIVTLGVPFARGEGLQEDDILVVNGALTNHTNQTVQWYPQGARWDDGSIKYARCTFRTDLAAQQEKQVTISRAASGTAFPYTIDPNLVTAFLGTTIAFKLEGISFFIPMINVILGLEEGGGATDHYGRYRYFAHLPNASDPKIKYLWVELTVEVPSALNHIQFYFRFGFYRFYPDMPNEEGVEPVINLTDFIRLDVIGPRTKIKWQEYKVPFVIQNSDTNVEYILVNPFVPGEEKLAAGSSHCYKGVLTYDSSASSSAELEEQILAIAEDWKTSFPITGIMPERPPYITSDANALVRSNNRESDMRLNMINQPGVPSPYIWPNLCNNPNTADAGQHGYEDYAFGLRGWPIMSTANYNWIPYIEFCTRQQALRHNWYLDETGSPVSPNEYKTRNVRFWNGAMFKVPPNGDERFCGFSRPLSSNDVCRWRGGLIAGPDKEHFTITMFMIQAFITMDWFSLQYAEMYSKYWIYANRTDVGSLGWTAIEDWGTSRATGRTFQNASFLREFYADSELEYWIRRRLNDNLARGDHTLLDHNVTPGGTEVIRAANIQSPCDQGSCLPAGDHYRPWEEGQAALGFYCMAKCLLASDPNDVEGLRMLEIARDISATVLLYGYSYGDGRVGESTYRTVQLIFPSEADCDNFIAATGDVPHTLNSTGLNSNAFGKIFFYHKDNEIGGFPEQIQLRVYMREAGGAAFIPGELFRLPTGQTGPVRFNHDVQGSKARIVTSPTNGYARNFTEDELLVRSLTDPGGVPPNWPVGLLKYVRWSTLYAFNVIQCLAIAKEAADLDYYPDSNQLIYDKAISLLNYMIAIDNSSTTNGFDENLQCFMGYLIPNLVAQSGHSIYVSPLISFSEMGEVTTSISNPTVNISVQVPSTTFIIALQQAAVTTTNSSGVRITPSLISFTIETQNPVVSAGATKIVNFSTLTITPSTISSVLTTINGGGRRVFTSVYMGEPNPAQDPVDDGEGANGSETDPVTPGVLP